MTGLNLLIVTDATLFIGLGNLGHVHLRCWAWVPRVLCLTRASSSDRV